MKPTRAADRSASSPGASPSVAEGPDSRRGPGPSILGLAVDAAGRCAHYRGPHDVLAVRLPCCEGFYACHACHEALADHPARPWPRERFEAPAVLCGLCRRTTSIARYLAAPDACSHCGAAFNPRCRRHHRLYFDGGGGGVTRRRTPP